MRLILESVKDAARFLVGVGRASSVNTATVSVVVVIKQEAQSSNPPSQLSDTEGK